ncbi:MAG: heme exporter protein CcmB [Thermoanaerobaculia bacterium]|nr:heme exporter protein CcmB [Thermoanaerobaculia bacterium]
MIWLRQALAVLAKDWRTELRTRHALHTIALFAVTTLVTVSLALGPAGVSSAERTTTLPVILWIILLFAAAAGLPRSFVAEEEGHTADALRLSALPSAIFAGKAAFSIGLLWGLELLLTPLFLAMMDLPVGAPAALVLILLLGALGLAVASVLVAAMVAQARSRGALFPVLAFPLLLPLLMMAVELTRGAVVGGLDLNVLQQLVLYDASLTVGGLMLFPVIWNP